MFAGTVSAGTPLLRLYAISDVITAIPEPSTRLLGMTAVLVVAVLAGLRRPLVGIRGDRGGATGVSQRHGKHRRPDWRARCTEPRKGPSSPVGAYLSEWLVSAVLKTGLVLPIPKRAKSNHPRGFRPHESLLARC
jgi:hypothetical protein